jgi:hypothetical protein
MLYYSPFLNEINKSENIVYLETSTYYYTVRGPINLLENELQERSREASSGEKRTERQFI